MKKKLDVIRFLPSPMASSSNDAQEEKPAQKRFIEWLTFLLSLGIVGGLVLLVSILWFSSGDKKLANPVIQVKQEQIFSQSGQFYVPFEIINQGDETATQIQVIGELKINNTIEQSGEQTIDFLSRQEVEKGVFVFQADPRQGNLSIRVTSYQIP